MRYDLVFEGGGAKGIALVGALEEFLRRGHTFDRLLGTSAGAITATLLAAGYGPDEMRDVLAEREGGKPVFAGFMGAPPPFTREEIDASELRRVLGAIDVTFIPEFLERKLDDQIARLVAGNERFRHVLALVERGGWFAADRFVSWLVQRLDTGTRNGAPRAFSGLTLAQLHVATGVELSMVVSDTTDGKLLVLNHHTAPSCPVVWAVRMSMSIPLVWDEVVWKAGWGSYLGRDLAGHAIVDGGVLSNFPIELFISDAPQVQKLMGPKRDTPVLGLLIDEELPVPPLPAGAELVTVRLDPKELLIARRIKALVDTATTAHDKMVLEEYGHLVARLPARGYGTTEFDMTDERRDALVAGGRQAMAAYLDAPPALAEAAPGPWAAIRAGESPADRIAARLLELDGR